MRLLEAFHLRVQDIDFKNQDIVVRQGKGDKDRRVPLSKTLVQELKQQTEKIQLQHQHDKAAGLGDVLLPDVLQIKFKTASQELGWQFLFPALQRSADPRSGLVVRHHLHITSSCYAKKKKGEDIPACRRRPARRTKCALAGGESYIRCPIIPIDIINRDGQDNITLLSDIYIVRNISY